MREPEIRRREADLSALYAALVDRHPEPLLVTDVAGSILAWNAAALALAPDGASPASPRLLGIEAPIELSEAMRGARDWSGRLAIGFAADGARAFDATVSPLPRFDGEPPQFLCLLRGDAVQNRRAETPDRADAAPVMLWSARPDRSFDWFNARWLAFTGRSLAQSRGDGWLVDVHAEDLERCNGIFNASCEARRPFTLDLRLRRHDGVYRWLLVSAVPCFDAGGTLRSYAGSAIDIDERKRLEDGLAERVRNLRHAERRQGEFLVLLSHELRNPLAPIANAASVLRTLEHSNPILVRLREILERQVRRLGRLVEDLVDVTRAAQGQISLVSEAVAVDGLVRSAVACSSEQVTAGGHTLDVRLPDARVFVKGDAARLAQALSNLISNAAKFTPTPGVIRVSVEPGEQLVRITVKDHGQGFTPEFLPHAFELFAQQDGSLSRSLGGLGVGLTLARRIAQMHGGDIEAFSEGSGQGAELALTLPLAAAESAAPAAAAQRPGPGLAESYRVLIIEDDADAREALRLQMRMWGNEVMTAATGEEGLAAATAFKPHIVLCDMALPGMDGLQLIGPLRERLAGQPTLFAALTGHARSSDESRALASGFDSFVVKPLLADALAKLLRTYANRVH